MEGPTDGRATSQPSARGPSLTRRALICWDTPLTRPSTRADKKKAARLLAGPPGLQRERLVLGDLHQRSIAATAAAHRHADAAEAEQHHRPGRRFRNRIMTRDRQ